MKIRLILLSIVGVAAYIVLANFNSKMIKEASQPHPAAPSAVAKPEPAHVAPAPQPKPVAAPAKPAQ